LRSQYRKHTKWRLLCIVLTPSPKKENAMVIRKWLLVSRHILLAVLASGCIGNVQTGDHETSRVGSATEAPLFERRAAYPPFTSRVSTQTIKPSYGFSRRDRLVETADRMREAGFDSIKLQADLQDGYCREPLASPAESPADLLARHPSYQHVLGADFSTFMIWINPAVAWWDGLSAAEAARAHKRVFDAACHLLQRYQGSAKTFLLGHWEGDWLLKRQSGPDCHLGPEPTEEAISGMIAWLNVRADAVAEARRKCPASGVEVLSYAEVNCVDAAMAGLPRMTNRVLPHIKVDAISYSAYDRQRSSDLHQLKRDMQAALDFIRQHAKGAAKEYVFIGEFGFAENDGRWTTPPTRQDRAAALIEAAAGWGCPHVLWWQLYDKACCGADKSWCACGQRPEQCNGYWLIDNNGNTTPVYDRLREYNSKAHLFKNLYRFYLDRNPDKRALDAFSRSFRSFKPSLQLDLLLDSAGFAKLLSADAFTKRLFARCYGASRARPSSKAIAVSRARRRCDG
jgi:hypothetical protein